MLLVLDGIGMTDYGLQNVLQFCSRLETIKFRYGDGVTDSSLTQIAKSCPTIKSLSIDFYSKYTQQHVADHAIRTLLQTCTSLTELSLNNSLTISASCFPENGYFPFLHSLNLSECVQLNDFAIRRITESAPSLTTLYLNNVNNLTPAALEAIALGCPTMEDLWLISTCCFRDEHLKNFLRSMPKLFIHVTRYLQRDLTGIEREVHALNVEHTFAEHPNVYRERAYEKKNEIRASDIF